MPRITAMIYVLVMAVATTEAGGQGDVEPSGGRSFTHTPPVVEGDATRLTRDGGVMALIPDGHESYGWRYSDAFVSTAPWLGTRESGQADAPRPD